MVNAIFAHLTATALFADVFEFYQEVFFLPDDRFVATVESQYGHLGRDANLTTEEIFRRFLEGACIFAEDWRSVMVV